MTSKPDYPRNLVLAALPAADRRRVLAPIDSFISLISPINRMRPLEVGHVGNEGMVGISLVLGVADAPLRGLVQGAGLAWRFDAATIRREISRSPALQRGLNRYVYVSLSQLARTAACTRFHFVEARLARWLLMTRDRAHRTDFRSLRNFLPICWACGGSRDAGRRCVAAP